MLLKDLLRVVRCKKITIYVLTCLTDNLEEVFDLAYIGSRNDVPDELLQLPVKVITAHGNSWFEITVSVRLYVRS